MLNFKTKKLDAGPSENEIVLPWKIKMRITPKPNKK